MCEIWRAAAAGGILESGEKILVMISFPRPCICAHGHSKKLKKLSLLSRTPFFLSGAFAIELFCQHRKRRGNKERRGGARDNVIFGSFPRQISRSPPPFFRSPARLRSN